MNRALEFSKAFKNANCYCEYIILLTKITAARNGVALSYCSVRGLYFLAVVFATTIVSIASLEKGAQIY